jgi:hypothetical protein
MIKRGVSPFFVPMKIKNFFLQNQHWFLPLLFLLVVVYATLRNYFLPVSAINGVQCGVTQYNNYIIFKNSTFHLFQQLNLYTHYPKEHYDLFKYTPSFALIFGLFAVMPNALGLFIWNLLNVGLPILGFSQLLGLNKKTKPILLFLLIPEMLTSVLNSQSNGLILGLMLLALAAIQRENTLKAVVLICITGFIKIFGIALFAVFLLYPNQLKKAMLQAFIFMLILFGLPLIVIPFETLIQQYENYFDLLKNDGNTFVKYSVMAWLNSWFHLNISKNVIIGIGLIIQFIPLFFQSDFLKRNGIVYGFSWMIWVVIFNHMAESATFIIAVGAIMAFLLVKDKISSYYLLALVLLFFLTELGPSDIYPKYIRIWIIETAQLKVFPCIVFWVLMLFEMINVDFLKSK